LTFRANTLALNTSDSQSVTDFVTAYPAQICDAGASGYRLHLTGVVSLSSTTGFVFYANISSDTPQNIDGKPVGSGVATITHTGSGLPSLPCCSMSSPPNYYLNQSLTFG
jgi:hypothetical protein